MRTLNGSGLTSMLSGLFWQRVNILRRGRLVLEGRYASGGWVVTILGFNRKTKLEPAPQLRPIESFGLTFAHWESRLQRALSGAGRPGET